MWGRTLAAAPDAEIFGWIGAAVCASLVFTTALTVGLVVFVIRRVQSRRARTRSIAQRIASELALDIVAEVPLHARGRFRGLPVELEHKTHFGTAEVAIDIAAAALGADADASGRAFTLVTVSMPTPLALSIRAIHRSAFAPPAPIPGATQLPGDINPLASDHLVSSASADSAVRLLRAAGGPALVGAAASRAWRVSFDASVVRLEADGHLVDPARLREGIDLAAGICARLREAEHARDFRDAGAASRK